MNYICWNSDANSVEQRKCRPCDSLQQAPFWIRAGEDTDRKQNTEQQARKVFGGATGLLILNLALGFPLALYLNYGTSTSARWF
jgi:hypothetical protein